MRQSYGAAAWSLLRRRVTHILFIGGASLLIDLLRVWPQVPDRVDLTEWLLLEFPGTEFMSASLTVVGVTLAQAAPVDGWKRIPWMCAAGFAGVAVAAGIRYLLYQYGEWDFPIRNNIMSSIESHIALVSWTWCAVSVALTLFYVTQEREAMLARRARDAALERVEAQRTVMATRLDVMRARVEPEFLFGALAEVRSLYAKDRFMADELVDALITYLRAALPQMRGQASTLRREVDLSAAYAAVLQVSRGEALSLWQNVGEGLDDVPFAPMVLLPLTQAAFEGEEAASRTRYAIDAVPTRSGLDITLSLAGGPPPREWSKEGSQGAMRTLDAYYADTAGLEFGSDGTRHWARISLAATAFAALPAQALEVSGSDGS